MSRDLGNHIVVDQFLSLSDAAKIAKGEARIVIDSMAYDRCDRAHARLQKAISENRLVYGLTTGFGPLANRLVDAKHGAELQQNLVYHLASGVGPAFDWSNGRAMVLARLMSILQGASGASVDAINALVVLLNSKLSPCVPSKGTVGASGDLTPLAHMVLCFQGIGDFQTREATVIGGQPALRQLGLSQLHLERRDGLALVNGTSAMTGVAVINADLTERAIAWSLVLTAAMAEVLAGRIEAWHAVFSSLRPHRRQAEVADCLCASVRDSERVTRQHLASRRMADVGQMTEAEAGQDAYTLRCAPQVIGAVWDTLDWHNQITLTELNAVTDNPIFPEGIEQVSALHGGNFMGQHVGLASDALGNGICVLAGLAERQVARLTDERLNKGLPAFLHKGQAGLHSGLMGAQVTATALLAEMRIQGPASVQSISTNGANQDVVSMGTIAARQVQERLTGLVQIQAILALAVAQAVDLRLAQDQTKSFSSCTMALRDVVRRISPPLDRDRPLGRDIEALAKLMAQDTPP